MGKSDKSYVDKYRLKEFKDSYTTGEDVLNGSKTAYPKGSGFDDDVNYAARRQAKYEANEAIKEGKNPKKEVSSPSVMKNFFANQLGKRISEKAKEGKGPLRSGEINAVTGRDMQQYPSKGNDSMGRQDRPIVKQKKKTDAKTSEKDNAFFKHTVKGK